MSEINVEKIMEDIRKDIKDSGRDKIPLSFDDSKATAPVEGSVEASLQYLSTHYEIEPYEYLTGNKIKVFVKKVIRKVNGMFYLPVVAKQNTLNYYFYKVIQSVNDTNKENERLAIKLDELEKRVDELEGKAKK